MIIARDFILYFVIICTDVYLTLCECNVKFIIIIIIIISSSSSSSSSIVIIIISYYYCIISYFHILPV